MKTSKILALGIIALVIGTSAWAGGSKQSDAQQSGTTAAVKTVTVQVGYENNPGELVDQAINEWKRLLEERSGGQMKMEIFPSSQMGTKNEIIDQMLAGMNVITLADGAFFADRGAPDMGITMGPYLFSTWDEAWKLIGSDWWASQSKILEGKGLKVIMSNFVYGERHTLTTKPIRTVADFQGVKLRVPVNTFQVKGTEVMGANPTPLPLGEVYTALQQGVIDGVENPLSVLYGGKFHEVAKNLILDGHIKLLTSWFCGTQFFNTLTPQQQQWLLDTGRECGLYNNKLYDAENANYIQKFKDEGVTVVENFDIAAFQAKARPFYDLPEFTAIWSPNLYDTISQLKAGN
jgi:tripartite ATP-independent transporter DctP family solute receptor